MGSVAAGCRAEEKGALLFYRFLTSLNKFIISFSSLRNFLRTKIPPPGILIISYQWKEGYLSSSSYIYTFYKCYVISLYLAFCL